LARVAHEFTGPQQRGFLAEEGRRTERAGEVTSPLQFPAAGWALKPGLNALSEGAEVAHALELVVGQLDVEMLFEPAKQFKRLQAVNAQLLEEIVLGMEFGARDVEVGGGKIEDFAGGLVEGAHFKIPILP
jgi:hypothetical protein